jgi:hypothetical protein
VILSKFWSRYDFQNSRNQNFLGDDRELLRKGTVDLPDVYTAVCVCRTHLLFILLFFLPRLNCIIKQFILGKRSTFFLKTKKNEKSNNTFTISKLYSVTFYNDQ